MSNNLFNDQEQFDGENKQLKTSADKFQRTTRQRIEELLEDKKLRATLNDYDSYMSDEHLSYYEDSIFEEFNTENQNN